MNIPLTPLRFKRRAEQLYAGKPGVVCGEKRFTYSEFSERCDRFSRALQMLGIPPGSRIAFLALNCHRLLEAYYGVVQMGGVLLPLNVRLSKDELAFILNDSEAVALFYDSDFHPLVALLRPELRHVVHFISLDGPADDGWSLRQTYDELVAGAERKDFSAFEPDEDAVAEIFYTSGTTGEPKGVMLTHRNLYLHALSGIIALGIRDTDVQLHAIPLFHVNGWGAPQSLTCMGGTHVMMKRFDPGQVPALIARERVTYTSFVPTMAHLLVNQPATGEEDYSSLRMVLIGGAASSPELIEQVEKRFGCRCYAGYGLTETSPILTIALPKSTVDFSDEAERYRRQAMTGFPLVGVELGVVDELGHETAHDGAHPGEIRVRGDGVMKGYWRGKRETDAAIRDGWLYTGDIATIDGEGCLQIVDRKKDLIVSGGENVAPIEIESCLYGHEAVLECAVIGVPDRTWGEVPKAFVVLKNGMSAGEQDLIEFCKRSLAHYKCPKSVTFVESLPKGGTGKILKKELRRLQ